MAAFDSPGRSLSGPGFLCWAVIWLEHLGEVSAGRHDMSPWRGTLAKDIRSYNRCAPHLGVGDLHAFQVGPGVERALDLGLGLGRGRPDQLAPRSIFEKFAAVQMIDVHIPTTDGRELQLVRYTQPEPELTLLLDRLKLELPQQPPPKITDAQAAAASTV